MGNILWKFFDGDRNIRDSCRGVVFEQPFKKAKKDRNFDDFWEGRVQKRWSLIKMKSLWIGLTGGFATQQQFYSGSIYKVPKLNKNNHQPGATESHWLLVFKHEYFFDRALLPFTLNFNLTRPMIISLKSTF